VVQGSTSLQLNIAASADRGGISPLIKKVLSDGVEPPTFRFSDQHLSTLCRPAISQFA
jgi:hypothetical protein